MKRLVPERPFPAYAFLPGQSIHPNKEGGHSFNEPEVHCHPIDENHMDDFYFGLDLLNHGFYWESHVMFEALWNAHHRNGPEADLLKALIKIGAGFIKKELGQSAAATGHFERALELIQGLQRSGENTLITLDLGLLETKLIGENGRILPILPMI